MQDSEFTLRSLLQLAGMSPSLAGAHARLTELARTAHAHGVTNQAQARLKVVALGNGLLRALVGSEPTVSLNYHQVAPLVLVLACIRVADVTRLVALPTMANLGQVLPLSAEGAALLATAVANEPELYVCIALLAVTNVASLAGGISACRALPTVVGEQVGAGPALGGWVLEDGRLEREQINHKGEAHQLRGSGVDDRNVVYAHTPRVSVVGGRILETNLPKGKRWGAQNVLLNEGPTDVVNYRYYAVMCLNQAEVYVGALTELSRVSGVADASPLVETLSNPVPTWYERHVDEFEQHGQISASQAAAARRLIGLARQLFDHLSGQRLEAAVADPASPSLFAAVTAYDLARAHYVFLIYWRAGIVPRVSGRNYEHWWPRLTLNDMTRAAEAVADDSLDHGMTKLPGFLGLLGPRVYRSMLVRARWPKPAWPTCLNDGAAEATGSGGGGGGGGGGAKGGNVAPAGGVKGGEKGAQGGGASPPGGSKQ